jgi:hypothetical protein
VRHAEYAFRKNRKTTSVKKTNEEERSATKLHAFPISRKTVAEFLARAYPELAEGYARTKIPQHSLFFANLASFCSNSGLVKISED